MKKKGIFEFYTIDKLKTYYIIEQPTYKVYEDKSKKIWRFKFREGLIDSNRGDWDFELIKTNMLKLNFEIRISEGDEAFVFGTLKLNPSWGNSTDEDFEELEKINFTRYCSIEVNNRVNYEPLGVFSEPLNLINQRERKSKKDIATSVSNLSFNKKVKVETGKHVKHEYTSIFMLDEIADLLELKLHCITTLELGIDTNINYGKIIKSAIQDSKLIPVILNKRYENKVSNQRLSGVLYQFSATRSSAVDMTLYIKQSKKDLQLKCYNKSQEIRAKNNEKSYIDKRFGKNCDVFRLEITAKRKYIDQYCEENNITLDEFLFNLPFDDYLVKPLNRWINLLIRFNDLKLRTAYSIFDLREFL